MLHSSSNHRVGCIGANSQALFGLRTSRSHRATVGPIGVLVLSLPPAVLLLLFLPPYHYSLSTGGKSPEFRLN